MQLPKAELGRRVQHGRRGRRQLRQHPGTVRYPGCRADPDHQPRDAPAAGRDPASGPPRPDPRRHGLDLGTARRPGSAPPPPGCARRGVRHGDRVLVHGRNGPALFETMWADLDARRRLGADQRPPDPAEVAYLAQSSGAAVHVFDPGFEAHAAAARDANPACRLELDLGPGWDALQAHGRIEHPADVDRDDPCWFFYTSGTTGRPKAGVLTHGQMAFVVTNHLCDLMPGTTEQDVSPRRRAPVPWRRRACADAGRPRRRQRPAGRRAARPGRGLAPGRAAPGHQHVHRPHHPDHADPARRRWTRTTIPRCAT